SGRADRSGGRRRAAELVDAIAIRCASVDAAVRTLSGGNQQKVVLGRWTGGDGCRVLLLDEPTRGIDVGAKAEIYMLLDRLCAEGVAVLVSSSELPELLTLSDRIYAIREGRMTGHFTREEATEERIARAMAGLAHAE
ncbi:MAG: sugar ABC transporter ATP-binding protein, partial [Aeromicrobium sp.]